MTTIFAKHPAKLVHASLWSCKQRLQNTQPRVRLKPDDGGGHG
jgi:hypothetical protein